MKKKTEFEIAACISLGYFFQILPLFGYFSSEFPKVIFILCFSAAAITWIAYRFVFLFSKFLCIKRRQKWEEWREQSQMIKLYNWIRGQRVKRKSIFIHPFTLFKNMKNFTLTHTHTVIFIKSFQFHLKCFGVWCFGVLNVYESKEHSRQREKKTQKFTHAFSIQLVNSLLLLSLYLVFVERLHEQIYFKFFVSLDFQLIYINIFMQWKTTAKRYRERKKYEENLLSAHCIYISTYIHSSYESAVCVYSLHDSIWVDLR